MKRHALCGELGPNVLNPIITGDDYTQVTPIDMLAGTTSLGHGLGQAISELRKKGLAPSEIGIDLAILSALITVADTRIEREVDAQDSWTREIDIHLHVSNITKWNDVKNLLCKMLKFLTGDIWRFYFYARPEIYAQLAPKVENSNSTNFSSISLFSGGLDSYIGAIDLFEKDKENPLFVSHYWDLSTSKQEKCAGLIRKEYSSKNFCSIRSRVGFKNGIIQRSQSEGTLRGRSFLFFALAALAASCSRNIKKIFVPENGLISLNVPLDPLRLGAWSTRTTHPYYLARWNELLEQLEIDARLENPYRFKTKGEMVKECLNQKFLKKTYTETLSCSSVSKARWEGESFGHCGYCLPCLIRRAANNHGFGGDTSRYVAVPELDARITLNSLKAEGRDVRSFQLMKEKLSKSRDIHTILVHKSGPLNDYPDVDVKGYADVFRRGIFEVDALLKDVVVKPR